MISKQKNYIFRVGDGENFENSGYDNNLWGISSDNKCSLSLLKKFNKGDIIWFSTTKGTKYNGKIIAVAEYDNFLDRDKDENKKKKYCNENIGWKGDINWNILIFVKNLYDIRHLDIKVVFACSLSLFTYESYIKQRNKKEKAYENLETHYKNIKYYCKLYSDENKEKKLLTDKIEKLEQIIEINDKKIRDVMTSF